MSSTYYFEDDNMSKLRSEFAANVSHELKTPLTSIKGLTDMLLSGVVKNEEDQLRFITMISVETDRMINLINDVLSLSELQNARLPSSVEKTEVLSLAKDVAESLAPAAYNANVTITVSGEECYLKIERERLRMLIFNLAENAVKYNRLDGSVAISVNRNGPVVSILVSDTGIGIPKEHQSRIFERFYRVDKSRSKKTGGNGLGLAIVKHITVLYGGRLSLISEVGVGTSITVEFDSK
jgi:two-component system phosphate regulon sensor histidine kinase PhoR